MKTEIEVLEAVTSVNGDRWERITPWRVESDGCHTCWVKAAGKVTPIVFRVYPNGNRNIIALPDLNPT